MNTSSVDYEHARWLVELSSLYHVDVLKKAPPGAETYAAVDIASRPDALEPSGTVRAAFERHGPGKTGSAVT